MEKEVSINAGIMDKDTLVMRMFVGEAKSASGELFEMCIHAGQSNPIIKLPTGEVVVFSWESLLNAALEAVERNNA